MLERLTCVQGHAWEACADTESARCPECGLPPDPGMFAEPDEAPAPAPPPISDDKGKPVVVGYEILADRGKSLAGVRLYQAKQLVAGREVLLAVVLAREDAGQRAWNALRGEASGHGRLSHPHIVQLYETGERERQLFYSAMEFVDGPTLAEAVGDEPVHVAQAVALVELLARAVAYAHAQRQFHRHLEPSAVLLQRVPAPESGPAKANPGGGVCLLGEGYYIPRLRGFGLARRPVEGDILDVDLYAEAGYLSPEQSWGKGQELGPHTDVYGLGGILYFLLTGRPPFRGPTQEDVIDAIQTAPLIRPSDIRRTPATLDFVCRAALARRVSRRYADATEMGDDLRRVMENQSLALFRPTVRQRVNLWRKRRPGWAALLVMGMVCMASTLAGLIVGSTELLPDRGETPGSFGATHAENRLLRGQLSRLLAWQRTQDHAGQMKLAALLIVAKKGAARTTLDDCAESDRGFEWHYLDRLLEGEEKTTLPDSEDATAFAFYGGSNDKEVAVAKTVPGGNKATISILDLASNEERFSLSVSTSPIRRMAYLDNDKFAVLAGTRPGRLYLFHNKDVAGQEDTVAEPSAVGMGFDNKQLVVLNEFGAQTFHEPNTARFFGHAHVDHLGGFVQPTGIRVALLPLGLGVAVYRGPKGKDVRLWNNAQMDWANADLLIPIEGEVECMTSSGEGLLAIATSEKRIYFHNVRMGRDSPSFYQGTKSDVKQMAFSPDRSRLAVAYADGTLAILGFVPPRPEDLRFDGKGALGCWVELLTIPASGVRGLEFGPDGKTLAASGPKGVVVLGAWK